MSRESTGGVLGFLVFAVLATLACLVVVLAWPYFQEYDIDRVDEAAHRIVDNDDALERLRRLASLHGYLDRDASGVLHFYGTMYWAMSRNPEPFRELEKSGSARERDFVARISRDGRDYYAEWYGSEKAESGR